MAKAPVKRGIAAFVTIVVFVNTIFFSFGVLPGLPIDGDTPPPEHPWPAVHYTVLVNETAHGVCVGFDVGSNATSVDVFFSVSSTTNLEISTLTGLSGGEHMRVNQVAVGQFVAGVPYVLHLERNPHFDRSCLWIKFAPWVHFDHLTTKDKATTQDTQGTWLLVATLGLAALVIGGLLTWKLIRR